MLKLRPITFGEAAEFVAEHHRHNRPPVGHKFSIACYDGDRLCGVAMVGRPVGRYYDDGLTLEVNRCCTDGTKNACAALHAVLRSVESGTGTWVYQDRDIYENQRTGDVLACCWMDM